MKTKLIFILTALTFSSGAFASLEGTFCLEGYHYDQRITLDQSKNTYRIQSDLSISNMEGRMEVINSEQLKLFEKDNVASNQHKNLKNLGIYPQDLKEKIKKIVLKNL